MKVVKSTPSLANRVRKKLAAIAFFVSITFIIIALRLFHLQINLSRTLFSLGQKNFLRIEKVESPRGNILDAYGTLLATNRPIKNIYWHGTGQRSLNAAQQEVLHLLINIINTPIAPKEILTADVLIAEKKRRRLLLASDIDFEQLSKIAEQFPNHENIIIDTSFKRYYPYKSYASHILGYLGRINVKQREGKMGLEKMFETNLRGEQGEIAKTIDSVGKNLASKKLKDALVGNNIQTTLDIGLQDIIETVFPDNQNGTFIVMDPETGAIRAILSRPSFDPSIFLKPIKIEEWQALQKKRPFLNRAFNASYPPGSIFKLVTISASLEHGLVKADTTWECKGYHTFANRKYWCHRRYGHGELTTKQAVAQSCNIIFYQIGERIPIDLLADYAYRFGLGEKTNIIFPEGKGLIPTTEWKLMAKGERWWPGETLSATIGQSFLLVTPIQIARMISSIFTGQLVTPRILINEPVQKRKLEIKPETLTFLKESMRSVITRGTGRRLSRVKDIIIHAKTSTAQTSAFGKQKLGNKYREHGWFVAHANYKQHAPITLVILAEHAGSSRVATDIAKNFLLEYKKLMDKKGKNG